MESEIDHRLAEVGPVFQFAFTKLCGVDHVPRQTIVSSRRHCVILGGYLRLPPMRTTQRAQSQFRRWSIWFNMTLRFGPQREAMVEPADAYSMSDSADDSVSAELEKYATRNFLASTVPRMKELAVSIGRACSISRGTI
jgi:hypothetical protein